MLRLLTFIAIALATVASSAWAYRVLEQTEDAYELSLGVVTLPADERGTVIFNACATCRTTTLRVTPATRYFANGTPIALADLQELADDLRATTAGREQTGVYIYFDIASLRVNRLALSFRN